MTFQFFSLADEPTEALDSRPAFAVGRGARLLCDRLWLRLQLAFP
jgi:hypothetical protein